MKPNALKRKIDIFNFRTNEWRAQKMNKEIRTEIGKIKEQMTNVCNRLRGSG